VLEILGFQSEISYPSKPKYSNKYLGNSKKVKIDSYVKNPNSLKNNQASYPPPNQITSIVLNTQYPITIKPTTTTAKPIMSSPSDVSGIIIQGNKSVNNAQKQV